ncbi:MAG: T9SS type A sorting domain-containing protein [Candidatus Hatepunaea meridiana]|nr:T9SS type A sorting domain-containing protein [Candidatus Hatepunaea meridiana]
MIRHWLTMLFFVILLISSTAFAEDNWNIELLSETELSGQFRDVEIYNEVAYFTNKWGLVLYDISNPREPEVIRRISTLGITEGLFLRDTLLYVCDGYAGLRIYSVADPVNPVEIGLCNDLPNAFKIDIQDNLAYVTCYRSFCICIIDIKDPANPEQIGRFDTRGSAYDIKVSGDIAVWTGEGNRAIRVLDISDPNNVSEIAIEVFSENSSTATGVLFDDTLLYVSAYPSFFIYSLADPEDPELIGRLPEDQHAGGRNLIKIEDRVYSSFGYIIDVSDPRHPEVVSDEDNRPGGACFDIQGHYAYFGSPGYNPWPERLIVATVGRNSMREIYEWGGGKRPCLVDSDGQYVYMVDRIETIPDDYWPLKTFDVRNPSIPRMTSVDSLLNWVSQIRIINDDYLYITNRTYLVVLSLENPARPSYLNSVYACNDVFEQWGDHIYIASTPYHGIYIFDISDPENPRLVNEIEYEDGPDHRGNTKDIAVDDDYLYVSGGRNGLLIYSLEDPEEPELISVTEISWYLRRLVAWDGYVYVRNASPACLYVISVEDPEHPRWVSTIETEGVSVSPLTVEDGILYMAEDYYGMKLFSLEDPANPELIGYYDTPGIAFDFSVCDDRLYLADYYDLSIYDISRALGAWYLMFSEEAHNFGEVILDSTSEWELTISNVSSRSREITDVIIDSDAFECPFEDAFDLSANDDTTFTITFTPSTDTSYTGVLAIVSDDYSIDVLLSGEGNRLGAAVKEPDVAYEFALNEAYPNPFNSTTHISYSLESDSYVTLTLFDLSGREVAKLVDRPMTSGKHSVSWDASDLSSGIYMCRLSAGSKVKTAKLALVK